jgi:hypothetical protein
MGSVNRGTLPQNFLDSVTSGMRLPQPEPQYFYAMMAIQAIMRAGAIEMGAGNASSFVQLMAQSGGMPVPQELEKMARSADAYPNAVQFVDAFGQNQGDTVKFRRRIYEGGGYTEEDRQVKPDKTTNTTGLGVKAEEVPIVLQEYEGPFGASAVQPYAILQFDALYRANKDQLAGEVAHHLLRDYIKWLDTVVRNRFRSTSNITYADDVTNVLSFTAGAGHSVSMDLFLKARKALSDRERAPFANGKYMCIVPSQFNVDMLQDPIYRQMSAQHAEKRNELFSYLSSIQDIDFFECTTNKSYAAAEVVPNDGQAVPTGATVFEALLISPNAVGFGQAAPPTAWDADDTDFGKVAKVLWRSTQAFGMLDDRGVQRILFQAA